MKKLFNKLFKKQAQPIPCPLGQIKELKRALNLMVLEFDYQAIEANELYAIILAKETLINTRVY